MLHGRLIDEKALENSAIEKMLMKELSVLETPKYSEVFCGRCINERTKT